MGLCNPPAAGRAVPRAEGQCLPGPGSNSAASSRPTAQPGDPRSHRGCLLGAGCPRGVKFLQMLCQQAAGCRGSPLALPKCRMCSVPNPLRGIREPPRAVLEKLGLGFTFEERPGSHGGDPLEGLRPGGAQGLGVGGRPAAPRSSHSWAGLPGGGVAAAGAGRQECKHRQGGGGEERRLCLLQPGKPGRGVHETPCLIPQTPAAGDVGVPGDGGGPVTCVVPECFPSSHGHRGRTGSEGQGDEGTGAGLAVAKPG